jgi:hypothetical protein
MIVSCCYRPLYICTRVLLLVSISKNGNRNVLPSTTSTAHSIYESAVSLIDNPWNLNFDANNLTGDLFCRALTHGVPAVPVHMHTY